MSSYKNSSRSRHFWKISGNTAVRSVGQSSEERWPCWRHCLQVVGQQWYLLIRALDFNWFIYEKAVRLSPLNIFFNTKWNLYKSLKAALHSLRSSWHYWNMKRVERKTEEERISKRKGREDVYSRDFVNNIDGKGKICPRKFPKD